MSAFAEGTPTVVIELGGKQRELGYTIGAMKRAKELGVLTIDLADDIAFILALPAYVWACLPESDREELSISQIEELMNPLNAKEIASGMMELFKASLPKEEPNPNVEPVAVKEPTTGKQNSKTSGQLVSTT